MADVQLALLIDRFMRRIHMALHAKAPEFDPERLGPGGSMVLLTIEEMGQVGIQDLTIRLSRDKSQMTRIIQSLERKGVVERTLSPDDARVSMISLTKKGVQVVDAIQQALAETIDDVLSPISESEKEQFGTILRRALD